jgi:hypothetical protein
MIGIIFVGALKQRFVVEGRLLLNRAPTGRAHQPSLLQIKLSHMRFLLYYDVATYNSYCSKTRNTTL